MKDLLSVFGVLAFLGAHVFIWALLLNNDQIVEYLPMFLGPATAFLTGILFFATPGSWHRIFHFIFSFGAHENVECPRCGHKIDLNQ